MTLGIGIEERARPGDLKEGQMNDETRDPAFEELLVFLRDNRGFDFTGYKRASLMRRVRRRMDEIPEVDTFAQYQDYLEVHPKEFPELFNTILINVTSFFRDPEAWGYLAEEIVPAILENNTGEEEIRVWSAGCAAGEEAYTLAMIFAEAMGVEEAVQRLKVYATDVDEGALSRARQGAFGPEAVDPIPDELREKYFEWKGGQYVFRKDLRGAVIFGRHDLIQDAPISRLDLLVCRNTLIYVNSETQRQVLARFHFALNEDGYLFLGKAEMLLSQSHLFQPASPDYRIFKKVPAVGRRNRMVTLTQAGDGAAAAELGGYVRLREAAFGVAPLAQVVVDNDENLALANEEARATFDLQERDLGRPFRDLELSFRPVELRGPMERARGEGRAVTLEAVERPAADGETQYLDVIVTPLPENGMRVMGISIAFKDVTRYHTAQEELRGRTEELETAQEELQSTNEELETTNEELQSTVEELQTTNEELQSTNEEMETMNEELRTANNELQARNEELRERREELNQTNAFLESILESVEAGVVVIDRDFDILLWNDQAEDLWGLHAEEVEGRSLLSLDIGLPVEKLADPVRQFLSDQEEPEEQVLELDARNRRGQSIIVEISNTLRRAPGGDVEGVVLMMRRTDTEKGQKKKR
jgi:two-component system CheB/CheR fusion protein